MSATCPPLPFPLDLTAPIRKYHYICNFGDVAILTKLGIFLDFNEAKMKYLVNTV
jgi:hypothetical protein